MNALVPALMFLLGFVAGSIILWFLLKKQIADASERERNIAHADIRVAAAQLVVKDDTVKDLQTKVAENEKQLKLRETEITGLKEAKARLETTLTKDREKLNFVELSKEKLKETFTGLAADALKNNNAAFDKLCNPVRETLNQINTKITVVNVSATNLGAETSKLVKALQKPEVRGQWGEVALERVLEIAGLCEGRDFSRQHTIVGDDESQLRPDYIINLPGDKHLAIDAKAPIRAFLEAAEATDEESQATKLEEFAGHVKERVKKLASKAYHRSLSNSPEFVVLYLPTEAILSAALTLDIDLLENAFRQKVIVTGPTNLIAVMLGVAHGWKQEALATNAREIAELGKELYKRIADFGGHMSEVGHHLKRSTEAYNDAIGSLDLRVISQARKFEQLKVAPTDKPIPELPLIETGVRSLQRDEFTLGSVDGEMADADSALRPR